LVEKIARLQPHQGREGDRQAVLFLQARALSARAGLLLGSLKPFDDESNTFFNFVPLHADSAHGANARAALNKILPGRGKPAARYAAFHHRLAIPSDRLPSVFSIALNACRERTAAHIALPPDEKVDIEFVSNKPWNAYSTYLGNHRSRILFNADFETTVDRALELACHEGYPGHHVFNLLADDELVRKRHWVEFTVQPVFSPQSFLSEAAATVAPDIAFTEAERIRVEREILFPAAGLDRSLAALHVKVERLMKELDPEILDISRDYLDGKLEFFRAAEALEDRALMAHGEVLLRYLNEFRTYAVTYTAGRNVMADWLANGAGTPWDRLRELATSGCRSEKGVVHCSSGGETSFPAGTEGASGAKSRRESLR
jgi:hypothetical protein